MTDQTIILEVIECGMTGEIGLAPLGAQITAEDYMADTNGLLTAHDMLEHVNGAAEIGGIGDELEALGAIWFGRGMQGEVTRQPSYHTSETHISSDVSRMALEYPLKGFNRSIPAQQETDADEFLRDIIAQGHEGAIAKAAYDDDDAEAVRDTDYFDHCLAFMQAGYLKAEAKYGESHVLNSLFWTVVEAVEPHAKHAEYIGQQYELTIRGSEVYCNEYYEIDDTEEAA